jgi:hypothetical protein
MPNACVAGKMCADYTLTMQKKKSTLPSHSREHRLEETRDKSRMDYIVADYTVSKVANSCLQRCIPFFSNPICFQLFLSTACVALDRQLP